MNVYGFHFLCVTSKYMQRKPLNILLNISWVKREFHVYILNTIIYIARYNTYISRHWKCSSNFICTNLHILVDHWFLNKVSSKFPFFSWISESFSAFKSLMFLNFLNLRHFFNTLDSDTIEFEHRWLVIIRSFSVLERGVIPGVAEVSHPSFIADGKLLDEAEVGQGCSAKLETRLPQPES